MKTMRRQPNPNGKSNNFFSRHLYAIVATSSVLVLGAIILLSVFFANRGKNTGEEQIVAPPPTTPAITFVLPLDEIHIAQPASLTKLVYNPTLKEWRTVNGTVFSATDGASVKAVSDGKVLSVEDTLLQGTVIKVEHADGVTSTYLSLKEQPTVTVGQEIKAGDVLGYASNRNKQYSHLKEQLYLEMRQAGKLVDPMTMLPQQV